MSKEIYHVNDNKFYLSILAFIAALGGFLFGFDTAVISGTIGFVKNQFMLDSLSEGWFVSIALLGCIFGVIIAGYLSDKFGRKLVLILSAILFSISAIGCAISENYTELIIYRLVGGIGIGVASIISPMYISEISIPTMRGKLITLYQLAITIGILTAYVSNYFILENSSTSFLEEGTFLNWILNKEIWRGMFGVEALPALIFLALLFIVPESPRYLLMKNDVKKAHNILSKIIGEKNVETEISEIVKSFKITSVSFNDLFHKKMIKPLLIGISLAMFSQFSGINAIMYYGIKILGEAGLGANDAFWSQVTIGIVNVIFTIVAIYTIDKFGRKPLLIWGVSGAVISLIVVGILFAMNISSSLLLLIFILLFIACFAFSFGPVVWVILAEIYPTKIRGRAMAIATLSLWVANWIVGQFTPFLLETVKAHGTFWIFALTSFPAIWVTWKYVPETKNKPLEEIEKVWN
ncbi:MAG: sugar porter family MFS transporter [Ignavibacteriae bacterium]|nr:sugar porter family MFS transporter [Ignavibacteriota bacterium]